MDNDKRIIAKYLAHKILSTLDESQCSMEFISEMQEISLEQSKNNLKLYAEQIRLAMDTFYELIELTEIKNDDWYK